MVEAYRPELNEFNQRLKTVATAMALCCETLGLGVSKNTTKNSDLNGFNTDRHKNKHKDQHCQQYQNQEWWNKLVGCLIILIFI